MKDPTEFWNEMDSLVSSGKKLLQAMRDALTEQQEGMKHVSLVWSNDMPEKEIQERLFLQEHRDQVDLVLYAVDKTSPDLAEIEKRVNVARWELEKKRASP